MNAYDKLKRALEKAQEREYTNGMATAKVSISTVNGNIDVIRKCGDLDKPEIFLLIIKPNCEAGQLEPNRYKIKEHLETMLGISQTDLNIVTKQRYKHEQEYTCIIPVSLF